MDTFLLLKETLDVQMFVNLISTCKPSVVGLTGTCKHCVVNLNPSYEGVWITGIICFTILLLTISVLIFIYFRKKNIISFNEKEIDIQKEAEKLHREHQMDVEKEKEKARYRERLANFIELQAKGITKDEKVSFSFNDQIGNYYVDELKSFIKELKPTNNEFPKKDSSTNPA